MSFCQEIRDTYDALTQNNPFIIVSQKYDIHLFDYGAVWKHCALKVTDQGELKLSFSLWYFPCLDLYSLLVKYDKKD